MSNVNPAPPTHLKTRGREVWRQRWARNRAFWKLAYYLVARVPRLTRMLELSSKLVGASDGIRTRDSQIHNLELYQLSYTRHRR